MKIVLYTQQSLKIKDPVGGFQNGGWYNGHQYYFGTFSEKGEIHPFYNIFSENEVEIKTEK